MRNRKIRQLVMVITVITGMMTFLRLSISILLPKYISYKLNLNLNTASSIGIIGGADGPTAIFLTSKLSPYLTTGIFALITVGGMIFLILNRSSEIK